MNEWWGSFVSVAGLVINGAGIVFIAFQVTLARRQIKAGQESESIELIRRRRQATTDAYNATQRYRGSLRESLPDDWNEQKIKKFLQKIEKGDARRATLLHDYLGHLETFSVAVSAGIYDLQVLDALCGPRLIRVMENYGEYIRKRRAAIDYDGYCAELQWLTKELSRHKYSKPPYRPLAERLASRPPIPKQVGRWKLKRSSARPLPRPDDLSSLVLRTDFTDDATWIELQTATGADGATYVNDSRYRGVTVQSLVDANAAAADDDKLTYLFIADAVTMADAEHPLLAVDLHNQPGRTFRLPPRWYADVSANLCTANLDFRVFADAADASGTYPGVADE